MIARLIIGFALSTAAIASQAQGTIAPTGNTSTAEPASAAGSKINPFQPTPAAPEVPAASVEAIPVPEIDPEVAALEATLREMREGGERIGTIDGKVIYRHEGRYLIEAAGHEKESTTSSADKLSSLPGECVIRVITAPAGAPSPVATAPTSNR